MNCKNNPMKVPKWTLKIYCIWNDSTHGMSQHYFMIIVNFPKLCYIFVYPIMQVREKALFPICKLIIMSFRLKISLSSFI